VYSSEAPYGVTGIMGYHEIFDLVRNVNQQQTRELISKIFVQGFSLSSVKPL
jgi:hypothetical protein